MQQYPRLHKEPQSSSLWPVNTDVVPAKKMRGETMSRNASSQIKEKHSVTEFRSSRERNVVLM